MSGPTLRFRFFTNGLEPERSTAGREGVDPAQGLERARKTWWEARRRLSELEAHAGGSVFAKTDEPEEEAEVEQSDAA